MKTKAFRNKYKTRHTQRLEHSTLMRICLYLAIVEREYADIAAVVYVVAPHDGVGVILHPDAGQRVPTDLIILIQAL